MKSGGLGVSKLPDVPKHQRPVRLPAVTDSGQNILQSLDTCVPA